jgi:hypothetical protein
MKEKFENVITVHMGINGSTIIWKSINF